MAMSATCSRVALASKALQPAQTVVARNFATEKQILLRITATQNLKKITSSMKLVSAAKSKGDMQRLAAARPFNKWSEALGATVQPIEEVDTSGFPATNLFVSLSSDRGLCGGVNSFITRGTKKISEEMKASNKDFKLVVIGEKGRGQMRRTFSDQIVAANTDVLYPATFNTVSAITNEVMKVDPADYEAMHILYNQYVSAIAYVPTIKTLGSLTTKDGAEPLVTYEFEPDTKSEVLTDLSEFMVASELFVAMMENAASEQSSRTQAMENASKNAGELIDALTLQYNKARQARITTELIEIISGASALE